MTREILMSRRTVLGGMGALALTAALSGTFATPTRAFAVESDEFELLRQRWVDLVTGRKGIDVSDPRFQKSLTTLDTAVATNRAKFAAPVSTRASVFTDLPVGPSTAVTNTLRRLEQMATAWLTPGSAYFGDAALLQETIAGLDDTNRLIYNDQQVRPQVGNWWDYQIGGTRSLANSMVLLHDELTTEQLTRYAAAIDHWCADPWRHHIGQPIESPSVGANRVDQCMAVIVRSIALPDPDRLAHAREGLTETWAYVTSGDGLHRDGSFIQHQAMAYTGQYGMVLLRGLSQMFTLLAGTAVDITSAKQDLYDAVDNAFAPVIYDCQLMDSTRGRGITRSNERSHDAAYFTIEMILTLAQGVDSATAARWRGMCAGWIARDTFGDIRNTGGLMRLGLVQALDKSAIAPTPEPIGHKLFAGMDRAVHRRSGWALNISMSSERISWYECGNGENNRGYFTGSGMTYLFTRDNGQFDDEFWPTVDQCRLPGTTVDTTPLPPKVTGEWADSAPATTWAGGAVLGNDAVIGQDVEGPGTTGMRALKSWFCLGDYVVALGADIRSTSGKSVETIIENRNLRASIDAEFLVNGRPVAAAAGAAEVVPAKWAHLEGVGGYLFPGGATVNVKREDRTGSWRDIATNNTSTTPLTRRYLTAWIDHGVVGSTRGQYAYVLAPGADAARTAQLAAASPVEILRNTSTVQAVRRADGSLVAANFWAAGSVDFRLPAGKPVRVTVDQPCALLLSWSAGGLTVAVADPTQHTATVRVSVEQAGWHLATRDTTIRVEGTPKNRLVLVADTAASLGITHRASFVKAD